MMAQLLAALDAVGGIRQEDGPVARRQFQQPHRLRSPRAIATQLSERTRLDVVLSKAVVDRRDPSMGSKSSAPTTGLRGAETIVCKTTKLFYGGKHRAMRYKEVDRAVLAVREIVE